MTCWRRLRDWQLAGVWDLIHFAALDWLARYGCIDWFKAVVDSCSIRAVYGGDQTGPNPADREGLKTREASTQVGKHCASPVTYPLSLRHLL